MHELTRERILAMPAGRELDSLVRKHVFGWSLIGDGRSKSPDGYQIRSIPNYSTDISAAWEVIEKFPVVNVSRIEIFEGHFHHAVEIFATTEQQEGYGIESITASEAICKAALLAVMGL